MNSKIFTAKPAWAEGIIIVRIFTGILIIKFGWEMFNPPLMNDYTNFLTAQNFPLPKLSAYLAKVAELAGGVFLILGLFTRLIVWPVIFTMGVIIWFTGGGNFFNGGMCSCFILLYLLFFFAGPGRWSLDYVLFDRGK